MTRRLRIQAVSINVSLVWDDGEELTPGPPTEPVVVSLSKAREMIDALPGEIAALAVRIEAEAATADA